MSTNDVSIVRELAQEADLLRESIDSALPSKTTLLVLNEDLDGSRLAWRDLVTLSWRLQDEALVSRGHGEHLQIVLFHPEATHTTYTEHGAPTDPGDYTIRSPHPTVQLLREVDVLDAVSSYPDPAGIPGRNRSRFRRIGADVLEQRLRDCQRSHTSTI